MIAFAWEIALPRLYTDWFENLLNGVSILNRGNAGPALGSSTQMEIRNDRFSLTVTGTGLVATEVAGKFTGFSAGQITGLVFRDHQSFGTTTVLGRLDQLAFDAADLTRAGFDALVAETAWVVRPLTRDVELTLEQWMDADITLRGGLGDETLIGGTGDDLVYGGQGNDSLSVRYGNDTLYGGDGQDSLTDNGGDGVISRGYGGGGDDALSGFERAYGGAGRDDLSGGGQLYGGAGRDTLYGNGQLYGGDDVDFVTTYDGGSAYGGRGNDRLTVAPTFSETPVSTQLYGGEGNDLIRVNNGLNSYATQDLMEGGAGDDTLYGSLGLDTLRGGDGRDALYGGSEDDRLSGGGGADGLNGGAGADNLFAGTGNDALDGGAGNDTLSGGIGNDTLTGGAGDDNLRGGAGSDLFIFGTGFGADRLFDFDPESDSLQFAVEMGAETTEEGVRLTSRLDGSEVILVGADLADVEGIPNVFLV